MGAKERKRLKNFIALLHTNRNFAIISAIQLICYFAAWFSHTGIFALLIKLGAPTWALSFAAALAFLPNVFLAPINGVIIDKFRPKPLLIFLMLVEMASVFCLIFVEDLSFLWFLMMLIFLRMGVGLLFYQIEMSLLPKLLNGRVLKYANEIHSIIFSFSYAAGMSLAGLFIYFCGIKAAFLLDFGLYLVGFWLLLKLNLSRIQQNAPQNAFKMMKDGVSYIAKNRLIIHLIFIHAIVAFTSYDALIALLAKHDYAEVLSASLVIGFLNASRAISLFLTPIILSRFVNEKTLFWLFIGEGVGICLWAFLQFNFYISFIGMLAAGFCTSSLWSFSMTTLTRHTQKEFYGRVLAYNDMAYCLVATGVSLVVGLLFEAGLSLKGITILLGCCFFVGGIYYKIVYNRYLKNA